MPMYKDFKLRNILFITAFLILSISTAIIYKINCSDHFFHVQAEQIISNQNRTDELNSEDKFAGYISEYEKPLKDNYYIHIDLDEKLLYLYNNGELIKTYPVSGGKMSTPSPRGKWMIINKAGWGEGFGGAWMGLNVPWGTYGIHGTKSPWFVGKMNVSNGCIRMKNQDAKDLFDTVPHGTIVTIYQNSPFRTLKSGDTGSDVRDVQVKLKEKGYFNGYVSGIFTEELKRAVLKFQKDHNLHESGIIYKDTYEKIMG